jgi:hypothetical protein
MSVFESFKFAGCFLDYFTCFNDILYVLLYRKFLYFQHQIKLLFLNMKN